MFTIERVNVLLCTYGYQPMSTKGFFGNGHEVLNKLDSAAGIDTSGGIKPAPLGRTGMVGHYPIGARLALHEGLLARNPGIDKFHYNPRTYFHWLGRG
jgi:hypothetical protein